MSRALSKILVTGIGLVTPLGSTRERTWTRLIAGENGIQHGVDGLEARVHDFSLNGARSRMGDFALLAATEALAHAGLSQRSPSFRIGCAVSQSKPVVQGDPIDAQMLMSAFFGWSPAQVLSRDLRLAGPSLNVVPACATGVASMAVGEEWLRAGVCDAVLVGAAESSLNNFYRAGFHKLGVLVDDQRGFGGVRPFDRDRSGFVMGEGAAVLVLETAESARVRGAAPLARLRDVVLQQSAGDVLRFDEDGAVVSALVKSVCGATVPGYINAHGTGTLFNDAAEARGIGQAFGPAANSIAISSTKAATGHLLGAAGAVEAAITVLALHSGVLPPTLNLDRPEFDLDLLPKSSCRREIETALSLSYGFGGQMGAVLFERCH